MDNEFIGQKFKLKSTTITKMYEALSDKPITYTSYQLDDPIMEEKIRAAFPGKVRITLPGTMQTQDHLPTRTNVHISADGIIIRISKG